MPDPALLVARGLTRIYGSRKVLDAVDLDVAPGEVLGLIGPNGGGKSTLLAVLAGLVRPSGGTVTLAGAPTADLAVASAGAIGLITSEPGLYPLLSGWENLVFFGGLYRRDAEAVRQAVRPLLSDLGVDEAVLDRPAATYSSGTRQKVSLARALLLEPRLLLLDEPTSNLDPLSAHTLHAAIRARADAGTAVVLATHDLHAAEHICDRVAAIDGRILGTVALDGRRAPPPPSRLLDLYPR